MTQRESSQSSITNLQSEIGNLQSEIGNPQSAIDNPHPEAPSAFRAWCVLVVQSFQRHWRVRQMGWVSLGLLGLVVFWVALVTERNDATIDDGVAWIADLCAALEIPGLARHGLTAARMPELVTKARAASSMKGNPIALTDDELTEIATASL